MNASARVSSCLSRKNLKATSTFELLAFCSVKGLKIPLNIWDRDSLEATVISYGKRERLARIKTGAEWDEMGNKSKIRLLHEVCNAEGEVTYIDPSSGYTVFSFFAHLKRGSCCGIKKKDTGLERIHRCRHCPYSETGELVGVRMQMLKARIPIIEKTRQASQELWKNGVNETRNLDHDRSWQPLQTDNGRSEVKVEKVNIKYDRDLELRTKYARIGNISVPSPKSDVECAECNDEKVVQCTRCKGWTFLVSPEHMDCPQCQAKGYHPCMSCTPFRPPPRSSFYS